MIKIHRVFWEGKDTNSQICLHCRLFEQVKGMPRHTDCTLWRRIINTTENAIFQFAN